MRRTSSTASSGKPATGRIVPSRYMQSRPSSAASAKAPSSTPAATATQPIKEKVPVKDSQPFAPTSTANRPTTTVDAATNESSIEVLQYKLLQSAYLNALTVDLSQKELVQSQRGLSSAFVELQELKEHHETMLKRSNQIRNHQFLKRTISELSQAFASSTDSDKDSLVDRVSVFTEQFVEFCVGYRNALSRLSARNFEVSSHEELQSQIGKCLDTLSSVSSLTSQNGDGKSVIMKLSELDTQFDALCTSVRVAQDALERLHGDLEQLFLTETKYKALTLEIN